MAGDVAVVGRPAATGAGVRCSSSGTFASLFVANDPIDAYCEPCISVMSVGGPILRTSDVLAKP